jgi:hypothetical protein
MPASASRGENVITVAKPEAERPLRRHRWENNIKMDLKYIVYEDADWIQLAQNKNQWLL